MPSAVIEPRSTSSSAGVIHPTISTRRRVHRRGKRNRNPRAGRSPRERPPECPCAFPACARADPASWRQATECLLDAPIPKAHGGTTRANRVRDLKSPDVFRKVQELNEQAIKLSRCVLHGRN